MLTDILNEKYISIAITIMIGLYAALLGPELPPSVKDLFSNSIFKIIILFLVVVRANKNPTMSLIIAIAFVLTLEHLQSKEAFTALTSVGYKLGEKMCEEEPESVENSENSENFENPESVEIEEQFEYLNMVDNMANVSYLENELADELPFEDFMGVDYIINSDENEESAISPRELKSHFEYLNKLDNMTNVDDNQLEDTMPNVESFVSM